jgi:hypothetical protein
MTVVNCSMLFLKPNEKLKLISVVWRCPVGVQLRRAVGCATSYFARDHKRDHNELYANTPPFA